MVACAEGRATLESAPSAVAGTVWLGRAGVQTGSAQLLWRSSHTVPQALNSRLGLRTLADQGLKRFAIRLTELDMLFFHSAIFIWSAEFVKLSNYLFYGVFILFCY